MSGGSSFGPGSYGGDVGGGGGAGHRGGHGGYQRMQSENYSSSHGASNFQAKPRGDISTCYVGNLNAATDRDTLSAAFADLQADVRKVNILLNDQGKSKGAGFVTFGSADEAQSVVDRCQRQGLTVGGNRLIVQLARQ